MTSHAGLLIYLELFKALGVCKSLDRNMGVRPDQGFSDSRMGLAFVLLSLAGGDCVDDLEVLEKDAGFCRVFCKAVTHGLPQKRRKAQAKRLGRIEFAVSCEVTPDFKAAVSQVAEEDRRPVF